MSTGRLKLLLCSMSCLITSFQYFFGLPLLILKPSKASLSHLQTGTSVPLLITCPNHLSLPSHILSSTEATLTFFRIISFLTLFPLGGSLGFSEEAAQSLPGRAGSQDVNDVLAAVDYVIGKGLAEPSKIVVVGLSHGGFLTIHLIGQAPDKFATAAARNPVCNLALMVGTTDIPDWCYFEAFGSEAKSNFTEAPSAEHLALFYKKLPISHVSKIKTPTLMLLGAKDLRVPITDGLQYARALKEKGIEVNVMMFPDGIHELDSTTNGLRKPFLTLECGLRSTAHKIAR
ncbi:hypothetical protein P3S67_001782 [Capsicum chacoense]